MLTQVLADMFMKTTTSSSQVAETGKATVDTAFQKIFDSSMQNSAKTSQDSNEANVSVRSETTNETDTPKTNSQTDTSKTSSEAETSRTDTETESAVSAKSDEKNADSGDSSDDTEKTDEETPAGKIEKLKKDDPQSYDSTIANIDNMNLGDLLSALGLNAADISGLKPGVDLTASVPEDLKLALQSGDWKGIGSALASLGIDSSGSAIPLSTLANPTAAPLPTVTAGAAGESSANLKNDSATSVADAAAANDSETASSVAPQSSTTSVSTDNSGSQTASPDLNNGSTGLGADSKSPASSVVSGTVNASSSESKPAVSATDPLKQTESVSIAPGAQVRTDGAAQQTESKLVVTTQNLTNETDKASAVSVQTAKSDQTQAQSNARAANSSRQTFERMVLDQVVDKARIIVRPNGASSMVIKLDPPSLGKIDMRIDVKDGSVRAAIVADSKEVKAAIEGNIENLKNSLNANGLKVDEISVTVGGDQGFKFRNDNMSQQTGAQGNGEGKRGAHGQAANGSMTGAENDSLASRAGTYRHSGLLDVVA